MPKWFQARALFSDLSRDGLSVLEKILQLLSLRCKHKNTSQPFTASAVRASSASPDWDRVEGPASHYVVCLDCGQKFIYDWQTMKIVGAVASTTLPSAR
jgi:hypothetical protein